MGNTINSLTNRSIMAATSSESRTAAPAGEDGKFRVLHGVATEELKSVMNQLKQFPIAAQALVSSRNPDL